MSTMVPSRRHFLNYLTKALLTVLGLCLAVPALAYVWGPLRRKRTEPDTEASFVDVGPVADVPAEEWRLLDLAREAVNGWEKTVTRRAVWVRREDDRDGTITVLAPICPHLGCPVNWHAGQDRFECPCHGGTFDGAGRVTGGPPPRGLDRLEHQVRAGRLWVRWQDFKIGVSERVPVGM